jgi:hypothetical protein
VGKQLNKPHSWLKFAEIFGLLILAILGVLISLKVGLSWDEDAEFRTYRMNMAAITGLLGGDTKPYIDLTQYFDRYYGIGFHLISHSIGGLVQGIFGDLLPYSIQGSRLIWAHAVVFLAFIGSGIIFRFCLVRLTGDQFISVLGMFVFLLWPYLFGHSMMNVKDIPFMCAWLCCTLQVLRIFQAPQYSTQSLIRNFALLGALTAWLISIRVAGILIFIQYAWFGLMFITLGNHTKTNNSFYLKLGYEIFVFFIAMMGALFILYPITWHDPSEFLNAIRYMSTHPWLGNTLTAGELIEPKTRLLFYIGSWLAVKLPAFALVGLALLPIVLWKTFAKKQFSSRYCALLALLLSAITILSILVLMRVSLYNELRQILFISAILLLIAIVSFCYLSRSLSIAVLILTIGVMVFDNVKMYPYQYSYVNEIARNAPKGGLFETDYFGLSVSETARWLNQSSVDGVSQCIYVPSIHLWKFEINPQKFPCVENFPGDLSLIKKPFLFFVQARSAPSFAAPPGCRLLHLESRNLPFSNTALRMGELYECLPPP